ncbi:glycoside hydrolase family 88 protein [Pendulispora albinea]|uniref:Glycoside hydrolase family 88 protein n=1 Tax=Pendulispora albinea TaxID=2741071 RepID=A0ABZ2M421_9BACT
MSLSRRALFTSAAGAAVAAGTLVTTTTKTATATASALGSSDLRTLRAAADYAISKLRAVAPNVSGFPLITKFEKWAYTQNGDWIGGFWPGTLWLAWLYSGDAQFKTLAQTWADKLAPRRTDTGTHDLGFLFYPSWVTAWRLTGEDKWRAGALQAAASLIQRYNAKGRFIRAWGSLTDANNAGRVIIDTMMNLDLLAFATEQTNDPIYLDIATEHAKTAQRVFLRPDGSTPHVYDFNPTTGAPIGPNTVQGYSPTSCWSRGQAWGIYGFTTMYRRTGDPQFLVTAIKLADFALAALTPDNVPVWDYLAPQAPNDIKDASAGVVMACGLLDVSNVSQRPAYRAAAIRILTAIAQTCLTTQSTRAEAIVARCTRNRPAEDGIEVSVPYGDYYLLEGILRILKPAELAHAIGL